MIIDKKKKHNIETLLLWQQEKVPIHNNESNQMEKNKHKYFN
jgi:hypothetical protein